MALTNIELYEALKKDLSEDSARMIAEVVPASQDLATKADLLGVEQRLERRITQLERKIGMTEVRLVLLFAVPLWGGVIAAVGKYLFS
jgi:allophanate hydrolase subunit 1